MYFTHFFAHPETLSRAQWWLTQLGFRPEEVEVHAEGQRSLSLKILPQQFDEIRLLFHAIERIEHEEPRAAWHPPIDSTAHFNENNTTTQARRSDSFPIGWHPPDHHHSGHSERMILFQGQT